MLHLNPKCSYTCGISYDKWNCIHILYLHLNIDDVIIFATNLHLQLILNDKRTFSHKWLPMTKK